MNRRGVWLALVLALCCFPLFIGLGRRDLQNDEAIYSFTVDRILETGDWLNLRASPHEDGVPFLEKPPLKFWIVAAPIKLGLLPHNEFGLRFWDAVAGSIAFLYVFLIGCRLFNPIAGAVAAFVLFAHEPLLFEHGLRDNAMDAPLLLCYCGAMWHFLAGQGSERRSRRWTHALAIGLYFVLGFMTKFVAALFLPLVLAIAAVAQRESRQRLRRDWPIWIAVTLVVVLLMAPWFVWAQRQYGPSYWDAMVGEHVYHRFSTYLDPAHVQPWYYYPVTLFGRWSSSGTFVLAALGLALIAQRTIRRGWTDGTVLLLWLIVPVGLISFGSSKLYHYLYPFLPPLALAAGYAVAMIAALSWAPFERALTRLSAWSRDRKSTSAAAFTWPPVRALLFGVIAFCVVLAVAGLALGQVHVPLGPFGFRSSSVFRPMLVAFACALPLALDREVWRSLMPILIACLLPWPAYRTNLVELTEDVHPIRSTLRCLQAVEEGISGPPRGLFVQSIDAMWHPANYYFRHLQPWERARPGQTARLQAVLTDPAEERPIVMPSSEGEPFIGGRGPANIAALDLTHDVLLVAPGSFAGCASQPRDAR